MTKTRNELANRLDALAASAEWVALHRGAPGPTGDIATPADLRSAALALRQGGATYQGLLAGDPILAAVPTPSSTEGQGLGSSQDHAPTAGSALEQRILELRRCASWNGAIEVARKAIWDDGRGMTGSRNRAQLENRVARALQRLAMAALHCKTEADGASIASTTEASKSPGTNPNPSPDREAVARIMDAEASGLWLSADYALFKDRVLDALFALLSPTGGEGA